jgi:tRNA(Arg) A34 adenosine deaminase TadA
MVFGIKAAISDAQSQPSGFARTGTVIVRSETGTVVAKTHFERQLQGNNHQNPLQSSIILAIQGISRLERGAARRDGMDSSSFQAGQYLCTGYDVYTTSEPTPFEAMALVHARIRRLTFGCVADSKLGGLTELSIHCLPGTNHKYRVFCCEQHSELIMNHQS